MVGVPPEHSVRPDPPPPGSPTPEEVTDRIKLELGLLTEEFKALKAEIVQNLAAGRQVASLSLTALGVLIGGAKLIADSGGRILFLLIPFVFHALAWTQLRYVALAQEMGKYLWDELAKKVRDLLREHPAGGRGARFDHILKWQRAGRGPTRGLPRIRFWLFLLIGGSQLLVPLMGAVFSLILSAVFFAPAQEVGALEWALLGVNVLALVYTSAWGWVIERSR